MLSRMAPSSPPVMRTLHLLKTPDILCANDISGFPVTRPQRVRRQLVPTAGVNPESWPRDLDQDLFHRPPGTLHFIIQLKGGILHNWMTAPPTPVVAAESRGGVSAESQSPA
jgi:hypothetical protein